VWGYIIVTQYHPKHRIETRVYHTLTIAGMEVQPESRLAVQALRMERPTPSHHHIVARKQDEEKEIVALDTQSTQGDDTLGAFV